MIDKKFILTGLLTSMINLILNALAFFLLLGDIYKTYPGLTREFTETFERKPEELIIWAMALTSLAMGYFITLVMKWSWARTFATGLKYGTAVGFLFWISVNSGLYASSHMFSLPAFLADTLCSGLSMTLSAAFAAWMLGRGEKPAELLTH